MSAFTISSLENLATQAALNHITHPEVAEGLKTLPPFILDRYFVNAENIYTLSETRENYWSEKTALTQFLQTFNRHQVPLNHLDLSYCQPRTRQELMNYLRAAGGENDGSQIRKLSFPPGCDLNPPELCSEIARLFPHLTSLDLQKRELTNEDLKEIGKLTEMQELNISDGCRITGEGLSHLTEMKDLRALRINKTSIDGASLVALRAFPKLEVLSASSSSDIDGRAISHIATLTELRHLDLSHCTSVGIADFSAITALQNLENLDLYHTASSDASISHIAQLPRLTSLTLSANPEITDASIPALAEMRSLQSLHIRGTGISPEGKEQLQQLMPFTVVK